MYTEKIKLANIMCSGCANTIKNELLKLTGVKNVQVDLENKIVILSYENLERNLISRSSAPAACTVCTAARMSPIAPATWLVAWLLAAR